MRNHIITMLDKHVNTWDGSLGDMKATNHRLTLNPGTQTHRQMPRLPRPGMRKRIAEGMQKMLHAGVIEPANSRRASPVALVSKEDGSLRICVNYRRLNAKILTDAYPLLTPWCSPLWIATRDTGKSWWHRRAHTRILSPHTAGPSGRSACRSVSRMHPKPFSEL